MKLKETSKLEICYKKNLWTGIYFYDKIGLLHRSDGPACIYIVMELLHGGHTAKAKKELARVYET